MSLKILKSTIIGTINTSYIIIIVDTIINELNIDNWETIT